MRPSGPGLAALITVTALTVSAWAQPPPPALVPPRPVAPLTASYPGGAAGDAVVILELVIQPDGAVRAARVVEGAEPFAAAALAAAGSFRFEPATRDGAPVTARIRVEVAFSAPAPAPAPASGSVPASAPASGSAPAPASAPASASGSAPAPASAPASEPLEVTVHGEALPPGATSLTRAEVRLLPGAFGDPFRAIEAMPSVLPLASGLPFFYVRGAPPGNVGYFVDGIRVPLLYHIGLGPSVIHPALIERVDLHPGGYPARFGRYAGGVVAGETRPPLPAWSGEASLRLVDAGALVEAPFAGGRGAALVGGRYAYPGLLLSLADSPVRLQYADYQARVGFDLTPRDRVTVFAFGAYDYLGQVEDGETEILFDTTFHRLDLRYDHRFGQRGRVRQAVTLGHDKTRLFEGRFAVDRLLGARTEIEHAAAGGVAWRGGIDAWLIDSGADLDRGDDEEQDFASFFSASRLDLFVGAFVEAAVPISRRFEITPGLRVDLYGSGPAAALGVDPRIAARLTLAPWLTFFQAHGLASQAPSFILPGPGFRPPLEGGLQRSLQSSAGLEIELPADITAKVTLYRSAFFDMNDALGISAQGGEPPGRFDTRAFGQSTGLELSAHRRLTRRLGGFLAYTLSHSTRSFGRSQVASSFDRTHVVNAAAVYDFGEGYKAGGRILFYTGGPTAAEGPDGAPIPQGERLPPFFRLDARLEKRWSVGRAGWISAVLEVLNTTLSKEAVGTSCDEGPCETVWLGPVTIPSLGVEGGF